MERLTEKTTDNSSLNAYKIQSKNLNYHCVAKDKRGDITYYGQHVNKLAEYENLEELIGIPLKDIAEIFRRNIPEDCKHPRKAIMLTDDDVDKWNCYKNAEEQGLMFRQPCGIGDDVYFIPSKTNYKLNILQGYPESNRVYHQNVERITFTPNGWYLECDKDIEYATDHILVDKLYKETWFLSQEEAEKRLKEMEGD